MASSKGKQRATQQTPGLSVTVTPSDSAFFAGESASFTITFANTKPPRPGGSSRSATPSSAKSSGYPGPSASTLHGSGHRTSSSVYAVGGISASGSASPSTSFIDLNNALASSSHIVLPERQGNIGSPLAYAPSSRVSSSLGPSLSPISVRQGLAASPLSQSPLRPSPSRALYSSKRVPLLPRHKKNDYSVAVSLGEEKGVFDSEDGEDGSGVSDLSSQLAGLALLQERGSISASEEPEVDAQPYIEQYKRNEEAVFSKANPRSSSSRRGKKDA